LLESPHPLFHLLIINSEPDAKTSPQGSGTKPMLEHFMAFLDSIYYEGYALELYSNDQQDFTIQYVNYCDEHNIPVHPDDSLLFPFFAEIIIEIGF
jgi:hypothetical protein